jgi:hypothetical protein
VLVARMPQQDNQDLERRLEAAIRELEASIARDQKLLALRKEALAKLRGWDVVPEGEEPIHFVEAYLKMKGGKATRRDIVAYLVERGVAKDKTSLRNEAASVISKSISAAVRYKRLTESGEGDSAVISLTKGS